MTNDVKEEVLTEEQKKFILKYLNKGNSVQGTGYIDPDKSWTATGPAEPAKSMDEWFSKLSRPFNNTINDKTRINAVCAYVKSGYSEMSELEQVAYLKKTLNIPSNPALSSAVLATNATTVSDFFKQMEAVLNDETLARRLPQHAIQSPGSTPYSPERAILNAKIILSQTKDVATSFKNYPATPKPEPVVEKPNWFETTSKDHQVRIEQWMEHLGMKDQAKALIDKYGLPVAYEIVQTSMQSPKDVATATDGTFRNSKDSIKYFLDNSVSVEKLATLPDLDTETVKASILSTRPEPLAKGPTIEMPSRVVSVPSDPKLSQFDAQKVQYAAIMRDTLKLEGIDEAEIKAAVDVAFKANLDNTSVDMESWSGAFKYNMVKALGLDQITDDKDVYKNWGIALDEYSKKAIETSATGKTSEELKDQVEIYTNVVNKKTLKGELASMSATETLNPETYFKDRQVQKQLLARAEKKAEREAKKAERTENRQERRDNLKEWFNNTAKSIVD